MKNGASILFLSLLGSLASAGCFDPEASTATPIHQTEKFTDTFTFALPSVDAIGNSYGESFHDGKKVERGPAEASVYGGTEASSHDGPVSLMRTWRVVHDEFGGYYQIRSGPYYIGFSGKYRNVPPTLAMLKQIFGKWILFKGDDMSRVREVSSLSWPRVLVFNDGRVPADTYAPDIKAH